MKMQASCEVRLKATRLLVSELLTKNQELLIKRMIINQEYYFIIIKHPVHALCHNINIVI